MRFGPRAALGYALLIVILAVPATVSVWLAYQASLRRDERAADLSQDRLEVERLRSAVLESMAAARGYLLTGDEDAYRSFREADAGFRASLDKIREASPSPEGRKRIAEVERTAKAYDEAITGLVEERRRGGGADLSSRFAQEVRPRSKALRRELDGLVTVESRGTEAARARSDAAFRRVVYVNLAGLGTAALVGSLLAVWSGRRLTDLYEKERAATRRAERAVAARDELLGVVAHDLRSPLGAITMKAGLLRKADASPTMRRHAGAIESIAVRMAYLIKSLLDAASIDLGRFSIDPAPVHALPVVRETVELFSTQAETKSIDLEASAEEIDLTVFADRDRLVQALSNLVGNAIRFTPEGGKVTVAAKREDGSVRFSVVDNGPGIAPEDIPRIFERFRGSEEDGGATGTGLGLYLAKGIVEAHGGRIWAESVKGEGARFHFTIPRAPGRAPSPPREARKPAEAGGGPAVHV